MAKKSITCVPGAKPARKLGVHGATLWNSIMSEYVITDSGGLETLCSACQSLDRAEDLRAKIEVDGELIMTKQGPKENPLLRHEIQARAFSIRTLNRLGLDVADKKPHGRPPGSFSRAR